jgi:hypothetical protein
MFLFHGTAVKKGDPNYQGDTRPGESQTYPNIPMAVTVLVFQRFLFSRGERI